MSKTIPIDFSRQKEYESQWAKSLPHLAWLDTYFSQVPDEQVVLQTVSLFLVDVAFRNEIPPQQLVKKIREFWDWVEKISPKKEKNHEID